MVIQEGLGGGHGTQRTSIRCFKRGRREEDFFSIIILNSAIFLSSGNSRGKGKEGVGREVPEKLSLHPFRFCWLENMYRGYRLTIVSL